MADILGTTGNDLLEGTADHDKIYGLGGNDGLLGRNGNDLLVGNAGADYMYGGDGHDVLNGGAGNDYMDGGDGHDILAGGAGNDYMDGGDGNDNYYVTNVGDVTAEQHNDEEGGSDLVISTATHTLGFGIENLHLDTGGPEPDRDYNGTGNGSDNEILANNGNNVLTGLGGNDTIYGDDFGGTILGGNDQLYGNTGDDLLDGMGGDDQVDGGSGNDRVYGGYGNDQLYGGRGNDFLDGWAGRDILTGGLGHDTFDYNGASNEGVSDSPAGGAHRDVITDFNGRGALVGDQIDLTDVDADTSAFVDDAFDYIGGAAFSGTAGELRYSGGVLRGDTDGDAVSDFEIQLFGAQLFVDPAAAGTDILL